MDIKYIDSVLEQKEITKDQVVEWYVKDELSLPRIKKISGLSYNTITNILKLQGIKRRSISQSKLTNKFKIQLKDSLRKKYGDEITNISQLESVKEKKRKTFLRNYGVDNIWKTDSFKEWMNLYMMDKFGKKRLTEDYTKMSEYEKMCASDRRSLSAIKCWNEKTQEEKEIHLRRIHNGCRSKLEINFSKYLEKLNISYKSSFYIGSNQFDYLILGTNILIEINGNFWHANPDIYKSGDVLNFPGKKRTSEEIWKKDADKLDKASLKGYHVIVLWESYLNNTLEEEILRKVYGEIKKYTQNREQIPTL